jgi:hypothetical protein
MQSWRWIILGVLVALMAVTITFAQDPTPDSDAVAEEIVDLTVETAESTAFTMEALLNRLTETPKSDLVRVLMVVGGVVLLVAGWRIYDFVVILAGILIGASIAVALIGSDNTLLNIAALLIGGLIGAVLSAFMYYAAVFVIGAYIGIVLTHALVIALGSQPIALVLLLGGLIGGVLLLGLSFEFLVLISSLVGAQLLSLGLGLGVIWTVVFTIVGIVVQLGLMRSYRYEFRRPRSLNILRLRRN